MALPETNNYVEKKLKCIYVDGEKERKIKTLKSHESRERGEGCWLRAGAS